MYWLYCGMPKGTSRAEATLNSEEIKPVAIVIIKLRWSEGIRQLLSQSVSQLKFRYLKKKFHGNFLISGRSESNIAWEN